MSKNLLILFLYIATLIFPQEKFIYKEITPVLKSRFRISDKERASVKEQYFNAAKDLTIYLPPNYDTTGKTDYTDFLQKGIDENPVVIMPGFKVLINNKGLALRSNSKIFFQKNSQLQVKENDKEFYSALHIESVENVSIYYANLVGERYQHQNTKGEWGMGIYIIHSKNILIQKPVITKFWGDGIYIGKDKGINSKNIVVTGAFIDDNRRNGISIISGEDITISQSLISNTNGTIPEYGIDIEPNKPEDDLININLNTITTFNNSKGGLLFALDNLQGKASSDIKIQVNNFTDYYSEKGIEFYIDRGYQKYTSPLRGSIIINGANLFNNRTAMINNDSKPTNIKLQISKIKSNNTQISSSAMNDFVQKFKQGKQNSAK